MQAAEFVAAFVHVAFAELALFASVCFVIAGMDELVVDLIWLGRTLWRRLTVYTRHTRTYACDLAPPASGVRLAVFIPAWDESAVIEKMVRHALAAYQGADVTLFVGCYPNDAATIAAVTDIGAGSVVAVVGANGIM